MLKITIYFSLVQFSLLLTIGSFLDQILVTSLLHHVVCKLVFHGVTPYKLFI